MIVVVMGVSGSGKSTVGAMLAGALQCAFLDADSLHSEENIALMSGGTPLTDADRAPWLDAIHARAREAFVRGECLVIACSALTQASRTAIAGGLPVTWIALTGPAALIRARLEQRSGHFMKAELLESQLDAWEAPSRAFIVDVSHPPATLVAQILSHLRETAQG